MSGIKRLITDRDVLSGKVLSPILLESGTLLTPAARDRAVQKGYVIVERDAIAAARGTPVAATVAGTGPAGSAPSSCHAGASHSSGCSSCSSPSCGGCSRSADGLTSLPDGLHLVRVEAGRVISALPAAGPGSLQPARFPSAHGGAAP